MKTVLGNGSFLMLAGGLDEPGDKGPGNSCVA